MVLMIQESYSKGRRDSQGIKFVLLCFIFLIFNFSVFVAYSSINIWRMETKERYKRRKA